MSSEPRPKQAAPEPPPPAEQFYAPKTVLKLSSHELGSPKLTVVKQFAVGQRVPQVLLCKVSKSTIIGDGVFKVFLFDPRYVRKQHLIPIGLESTIIPYVDEEPHDNELHKLFWKAERESRPAPTRTVDRKALAKLPLETPAQHCRRIFDDYFSAAERFFGNGSPAKGSSNVSFTLPSARKSSWTVTLAALFLGDPIPPRLIPSPITGDLLRELTPDRLEIIKNEILEVVEDAARKTVFFSNLGFEQFGYCKNERGVPVMVGLVDFGGVYFDLDDEDFDWYLATSEEMLAEEMKEISKA